MSYCYNSKLKDYILGFVKQKHSLGYPYLESQRVLHDFDQFCVRFFADAETITPELGNAWAVIKSTEKPVSFQNRIAPIRELAKYMMRQDMDAYVIPAALVPKNRQPYIPHIFTPYELECFFEASDTQPPMIRSRLRHLQIPVIFRLLYACGLRPHEARLIKCGHMNLENGTLFIPESKGHKDRMIVIPPDLVSICARYHWHLKREYPDGEAFFPCQRFQGKSYSRHWLQKVFHHCCNEANIRITSGNMLRPYDFRHTFATHKMYQWIKEGKDLSVYLPYLSAYMGHATFSQTAYYIHLIPELFSEMSAMDLNVWETLIPEVPYETKG